MLAESGQIVFAELFGRIIARGCSPGIAILGDERRITDLGRVKVQLEPFLSLC